MVRTIVAAQLKPICVAGEAFESSTVSWIEGTLPRG